MYTAEALGGALELCELQARPPLRKAGTRAGPHELTAMGQGYTHAGVACRHHAILKSPQSAGGQMGSKCWRCSFNVAATAGGGCGGGSCLWVLEVGLGKGAPYGIWAARRELGAGSGRLSNEQPAIDQWLPNLGELTTECSVSMCSDDISNSPPLRLQL